MEGNFKATSIDYILLPSPALKALMSSDPGGERYIIYGCSEKEKRLSTAAKQGYHPLPNIDSPGSKLAQ